MATSFMGLPKRREELCFNLKLNKTLADRHKQNINLVLGGEPTVVEGDTLDVNYRLCIEYFGAVSIHLKALNRILGDAEVVLSVNTEELLHGTCMIQETLNQVLRLQQRVLHETSSGHRTDLCSESDRPTNQGGSGVENRFNCHGATTCRTPSRG